MPIDFCHVPFEHCLLSQSPIEGLFMETQLQTNSPRSVTLTSIEQLVLNTITQDVSLTVGLLPADFKGGGTQSGKDQPAGGVWNTGGESCI